ncbi:hypothetical protein I7I50_03722 [Histoplasma capsulatum G186AR]|uniref:Uncharacterized protein n=1 Tax=Ajellomyces capsulatus TaxID=5037 RepID=A0A8H8CXH3_AJECA|nr:hypothetical protein I7I52_04629 [Histoplasma capsulatum]QSS74795.1 hypothetical protein I7I50_03722 [Histoplasma capsulatum G186AR]
MNKLLTRQPFAFRTSTPPRLLSPSAPCPLRPRWLHDSSQHPKHQHSSWLQVVQDPDCRTSLFCASSLLYLLKD